MKIILTPFYSFIFIFTMNNMHAQNEVENFIADTQDTVPTTPINNYLIVMLLLVIAIGYRLLRKKNYKV